MEIARIQGNKSTGARRRLFDKQVYPIVTPLKSAHTAYRRHVPVAVRITGRPPDVPALMPFARHYAPTAMCQPLWARCYVPRDFRTTG